eukprot:Plantae.Rhodophyta-Hildenbrandia_rubra.ctg25669.p1 GENE.Plantae.Rhodophyta-Hildenbrandia_rubra.ctg25669~~Plantae.Rhodophyta-Hildenbrandia_rubra.ctg25669.p1  ORF type:complete len:372 (+),score=54.79 Plantae.Rhodophyta-Hildenbrandia_rubra.ctg25669:92-1207(+)
MGFGGGGSGGSLFGSGGSLFDQDWPPASQDRFENGGFGRGFFGPDWQGTQNRSGGPGNGSRFNGFPGAFANIPNVSAATRQAFTVLAQEICSRGQQVAAWVAGQQLMPRLREWCANLSEGTGPIPMERIEAFIASIRPTIEQYLGGDIVNRVATFIRTSLADNAVISMLREMARGQTAGGTGSSSEPSRDQPLTAAVFEMHPGIECDSCGKKPITGTRYKSENRVNYDLCGECYIKGEQTDSFREIKYPWEASDSAASAPPAPLGPRDSGPHVAHLQKLLTDIGYMNPSMYRHRVGFFGPNTRLAVQQFQKDYGLEGNIARVGFYDVITQASLSSIIEMGVPPTQAAGTSAAAAASSSGSAAAPAQNNPVS